MLAQTCCRLIGLIGGVKKEFANGETILEDEEAVFYTMTIIEEEGEVKCLRRHLFLTSPVELSKYSELNSTLKQGFLVYAELKLLIPGVHDFGIGPAPYEVLRLLCKHGGQILELDLHLKIAGIQWVAF